MFMRTQRATLLFGLVALAIQLTASPSLATFPGDNGMIAGLVPTVHRLVDPSRVT